MAIIHMVNGTIITIAESFKEMGKMMNSLPTWIVVTDYYEKTNIAINTRNIMYITDRD